MPSFIDGIDANYGAKLANGAATGPALGPDVQLKALKDVANGYPGLDASGLTKISEMNTGLFRTFESFGGTPNGSAPQQLAAWNAFVAWSAFNNGGALAFGPFTYQNMPPMELPAPGGNRLMAMNHWSTWLILAPNSNTHFLKNHVATNPTGTGGANITSIVASGSSWLVSLSSAPTPALTIGQAVTLAGNTPTAFNGTFSIASIISSSQFTITNFNSPGALGVAGTVTTDTANSFFNLLENIHLDCNKANQTSGYGYFLNSNPNSGLAANGDNDFDAHQVMLNCFIKNAKQDGVNNGGRSSDQYFNVQIYYADGNGITPTFDSYLCGVITGQSGLRGFNLLVVDNVRLAGCDGFYSGNVTASSGVGLYVQNSNGGTIVCCDSVMQDNRATGWTIDTSSMVSLTGCSADSNSFASPGTYPAFDLFTAHHNIIYAVCVDRQGQGATVGNTQIYALRLRSTSTDNIIRLTHWACATGGSGTFTTVRDPLLQVDSTSQSNDISYNGSRGQQQVAYSATIAPVLGEGGSVVVGTLTGAITVNDFVGYPGGATAVKFGGQQCTFQFTQDATGGRVITFNAIFHLAGGTAINTTLSTRHSVTFEWDNTAAFWAEIARSA